MDWFAAGENGPLIAIRAIHFAASAMTTGTLVFGTVVGNPALRSEPRLELLQRAQMLRLAWIGVAITVLSGVIWLWFQAAAIAGLPLGEAWPLACVGEAWPPGPPGLAVGEAAGCSASLRASFACWRAWLIAPAAAGLCTWP